MGCLGYLLFRSKDDAGQVADLLKEYVPIGTELRDSGASNPRVQWLLGQAMLSSSSPAGSQPEKASVAFQKGLEAAIEESRSGKVPAWVPRWGGAEHLMNLAYRRRRISLIFLIGSLSIQVPFPGQKDLD
jgi:hypothetical protein